MSFQPDRSRGRFPAILILLFVVIAALLAGAWFLRPRFESEPPQIRITPAADVLGVGAPLEIVVTDAGAGLESVTATLSAGGTEHALASGQPGGGVRERKIPVDLAKLAGLKEGPAVLRVSARDASLWKWFSGNEAVAQKDFTIDLTPPTLELLADDRYVNFGGVGALVYKASADTAASGVKLGDHFFPGIKGAIAGQPEHFFVLFAHPYNVPAQTRPLLVATDKAGNTKQLPVSYELKNVKYKKSSIVLSDSFLQNKVAPLLSDAAARRAPPRDVFVAVNKTLRKENEDRIAAVTSKATPSILWKGAFAQLSRSKVEANFADERTYLYDKAPVDTAYHVGYDLSVTKHSPAEAANSGTVAFAGDLGIYGNTVILDHGLGLFTLYSHLSSIDVKAGDKVETRQAIGKTGETGLAAGDHLHYGVYLHGVPVLPVEWWDAKWIDDNIQPKLAGQSGAQIHEAQQPKGPRRAGKRRR